VKIRFAKGCGRHGAVFYKGKTRRSGMRLRIASMVLGCAAPLAGISGSFAQSAYDYPWCAIYTKTSGATSCYFASFQQCLATMRGIGGTCIRNPYESAGRRGRP
jgi:Protein of unknown function (DUF3551)